MNGSEGWYWPLVFIGIDLAMVVLACWVFGEFERKGEAK